MRVDSNVHSVLSPLTSGRRPRKRYLPPREFQQLAGHCPRHSTGRNPQILSAEHGLLAPHEAIRLYDTTLDDEDHWRRWSAGILARVRNYLKYTRQPSILVLAGARYADGWAPEARGLGVTVDEPLRGLELGARRAFARELLLRTPARSLSDTLDASPRDQLLSFAAAFRHRLRAAEAAW